MCLMRRWLLASLLGCALLGTACSSSKTIFIATLFPRAGETATIGLALQRGVDLAAQQFNLGQHNGYSVMVAQLDEARDPVVLMRDLTPQKDLVGLIGPYDNTTAQTLIPLVTQAGIATISPTNTLPGLTKADQANAENISFARLRPAHKPLTYFRLPGDDNALGKAAADLALAPTSANGLAAQAAFLVDDGTASGKVQVAAFSREFIANKGTIAGQQQVTSAHDNAQAVTSAIIEAAPDVVFYGGSLAEGAKLRATLSLTGAPQLPFIAGEQVADDPAWFQALGSPAAATATMALLASPGPSALTSVSAQNFLMTYQALYGNLDILPQTVMAYDATMVELTAIAHIIASGKDVTRSAVIAALPQTHYAGLTGAIAFDQNGDNTLATSFALYTCAPNGTWLYRAQV